MKKANKIILIAVLVVFMLTLTACDTEKTFFVYGTNLTVKVEGSLFYKKLNAVAYAIGEQIGGYEEILSPNRYDSDISKINRAEAGEEIECSDLTMTIMEIAQQAFELSNGAYDPSVYPLVKLWKFSGDTYNANNEVEIPSDELIAEYMQNVGLDKAFTIDYQNKTITKNEGFDGAMLDFGGVAKGYAVDKAKSLADDKEVLINLGGNISGVNKDFTIGIKHPRNGGNYGTIKLESGFCIATSGDYERVYLQKYTDENGNEKTRYFHHIINPKTGHPSDNISDNGLISVSIIAKNGGLGDALATACMVLGKYDAINLLENLEIEDVSAVLIDTNLESTTIGEVKFSK